MVVKIDIKKQRKFNKVARYLRSKGSKFMATFGSIISGIIMIASYLIMDYIGYMYYDMMIVLGIELFVLSIAPPPVKIVMQGWQITGSAGAVIFVLGFLIQAAVS